MKNPRSEQIKAGSEPLKAVTESPTHNKIHSKITLATGLLAASLSVTETGCSDAFQYSRPATIQEHTVLKKEQADKDVFTLLRLPACDVLHFSEETVAAYIEQLHNNYSNKLLPLAKKFAKDKANGLGGLFTKGTEPVKKIIFSNVGRTFIAAHPELSFLDALTIAQAASQYNTHYLSQALESIYRELEKSRHIELLSKNTSVIIIGRPDEPGAFGISFSTSYNQLKKIAEKIDIKRKNWHLFVGAENKQRALQAIRASKGPTTIILLGHATANDFEIGDYTKTTKPTENNINYKEFSDALIASGNLENSSIIDGTCFGADRLDYIRSDIQHKLQDSLQNSDAKQGWNAETQTWNTSKIKTLKFTYSTSDYRRISFSGNIIGYSTSRIFELLDQGQKDGQPITAGDLLNTRYDKKLLKFQLPTFTVGMPETMGGGYIRVSKVTYPKAEPGSSELTIKNDFFNQDEPKNDDA